MTENEAKMIIKTQIELLKNRNSKFSNITIDNIKNFSFMKKINLLMNLIKLMALN